MIEHRQQISGVWALPRWVPYTKVGGANASTDWALPLSSYCTPTGFSCPPAFRSYPSNPVHQPFSNVRSLGDPLIHPWDWQNLTSPSLSPAPYDWERPLCLYTAKTG